MLHISLNSPQHERLEDHVEPGELALVQSRLLLSVALNVAGEPLVELLVRVKHGGHDEVEQSPQLLHRVLDGGTGQEETVTTVEAEQYLPPYTVEEL